MKKFIRPFLFFLLLSKYAGAQDRLSQNSVSFIAAPNAFFLLPGKISDDIEYAPGAGYTFGLDFMNDFSKNWHYTLGLRYNGWNSTVKSGPLMWESEYSSGQYVYDPALPHFVEIKHADVAWLVFMGIGWHSKPKKWRWSTDVEIGVTSFTKETTGGKNVSRLTAGFAFGPERILNQRFRVFMQAGGRSVFRKIQKSGYAGYRFLSLQLEMGVRYAF